MAPYFENTSNVEPTKTNTSRAKMRHIAIRPNAPTGAARQQTPTAKLVAAKQSVTNHH